MILSDSKQTHGLSVRCCCKIPGAPSSHQESCNSNALIDRAFACCRKGSSPVHTSKVIQAWGKILKGEQPSLSIEITRECPLKCPGCYAYDDAHLVFCPINKWQ